MTVLAKVRCSHRGWQYSQRGETLWVPAALSALAQEPGDPWGEARQLLLPLRCGFWQVLAAAQVGHGHQAVPAVAVPSELPFVCSVSRGFL